MKRISRQRIESILAAASSEHLKYELIRHEYISGYKYSICSYVPKYTTINFETGEVETRNYITGYVHNETLNEKPTTLNKLYDVACNILLDALEQFKKQNEEDLKRIKE